MRKRRWLANFVSMMAFSFSALSAFGETFQIIVPTRAPHNANAVVWCHVPEGYDSAAKRNWRVLVYFGGRNCTGEKEAKGNLGWRKWADANGDVSKRGGMELRWKKLLLFFRLRTQQ